MRAKSLPEVRDILRSPAFVQWHARFKELHAAVQSARAALHDAADEMVLLAGTYQDLAARAQAESASVENASFELLSKFEEQRRVTTATWTEVDAADKRLEDERQRAQDMRMQADVGRRGTSPEGRAEAERLESRTRELEMGVLERAREVQTARDRLQRDEKRKSDLWQREEAAWSQVFSSGLARTEYAYLARRARSAAEALWRKSDAARGTGGSQKRLLVDADATMAKHRELARSEFAAVLIEEFLYWPKLNDVQGVYCVSLFASQGHLNIQVQELGVYLVERGRGVDFLEPLPATEDAQEDPRLHSFFFEDRPGPSGPTTSGI